MSKKEKKLSKEKEAMIKKLENLGKKNSSSMFEETKEEKTKAETKAKKVKEVDDYINSQVAKLRDLKMVDNQKFTYKVYFYFHNVKGEKIGSECIAIDGNLKDDKLSVFQEALKMVKANHKDIEKFSIRDYNFKTCDLKRMALIK